ncbi:MAG TPA: flagellar protein FlbB [Pseudolabrys sp.]|jgi:flagellar motility protein MotE (MotC chaperone)|nr:flagellar protein FlbB [Pseudolabrys sp.]
MTRFARDVRLIPIVLFATISLLALKVSGLVFDGGYTLAERMQARYRGDLQITSRESVPDQPKIVLTEKYAKPGTAGPRQPWAQEMFSFNRSNSSDVTGSVGAAEEKPGDPALKVSDKPPDPTKLEVAGAAIPLEPGRITSPGERAVLERLQSRRQELDTRNRELEMRENLLKAAEKRLEAKVAELKGTESRVNTAMGTRDKVGAERFKSIVSMYENMKPKDAARIFDRLEMRILIDVSTEMNPRKMSEIMAQMSPDAAERLTVELANRANAQPKTQSPDQLPKIEGKPTAN